jgi:hypothetical protein
MKTIVAVVSMFLVLSLVRPAGAEEWPAIPARLSLVECLWRSGGRPLVW